MIRDLLALFSFFFELFSFFFGFFSFFSGFNDFIGFIYFFSIKSVRG